jgi:hypothetical protein
MNLLMRIIGPYNNPLWKCSVDSFSSSHEVYASERYVPCFAKHRVEGKVHNETI